VRSPGATKRQKELDRRQKQQQKENERAARRKDKAARPDAPPGEDPDLAGIVPGPQPPPAVE
jgi:hypothetical protein